MRKSQLDQPTYTYLLSATDMMVPYQSISQLTQRYIMTMCKWSIFSVIKFCVGGIQANSTFPERLESITLVRCEELYTFIEHLCGRYQISSRICSKMQIFIFSCIKICVVGIIRGIQTMSTFPERIESITQVMYEEFYRFMVHLCGRQQMGKCEQFKKQYEQFNSLPQVG